VELSNRGSRHAPQHVGFRNVIVHGYDTVDLAVVRDVVEHRLGDLLSFVAVIRARI
jgi:uncharacterized protein YutE (UPF0331/DUF86 family)